MATQIDSNLYLSNATQTTSSSGNSNLDKDDFLKILITQLQHQGPMNPMEDKEFISQMANFSTLEQMTNMNSTLTQLIDSQSNQSFLSTSQLIGKEVEWLTQEISESSSIVTAVKQNGSSIILELENGREIDSQLVTKISS
ncbi:flagellar hook assembly protein FlgD [Bacillus carboniphilus]|uniref:Flagellar hook assembly protein FlgD n=1 Tax=Bacillus carboniphilus TaxID=86663 RepID=A0ABY9JVW1_9BACI|nr:flagellar hook assembly protein FlgD [Bacillus carboniphilus]WLR43536.1 flagellar hook assembly protein FlgD [Bacillus carboniphilus]